VAAFRRFEVKRSHQKVNLSLTEEADASTCLIGPVILPREVLIPTECVHCTSEPPIRLFRQPVLDEFEQSEAMCRDKRQQWLKYNVFLMRSFFNCTRTQPICQNALDIIIISHITTPWAQYSCRHRDSTCESTCMVS
jgi:hypothetical protein